MKRREHKFEEAPLNEEGNKYSQIAPIAEDQFLWNKKVENGIVKQCILCGDLTGSALHAGCSRFKEPGCIWNIAQPGNGKEAGHD